MFFKFPNKEYFRSSLFQVVLILFSINNIFAQVKSGPMLGYVELRTAKIWCEVIPGTQLELNYWKENDKKSIQKAYVTRNQFLNFETQHFDLINLEPGMKYNYEITSKPKITPIIGKFKTQELWQWRRPAPDFSIITGSCAYQNEIIYDRPGKPYGHDTTIFETMSKENADAMFWLGDNWYTREVDYFSEWGLWYRASRDRSLKILQPLLKNMSNYAIWDDHDYGPNNEGVSYIFKEESRKVFKAFTANPTYGLNNQGSYTKVSVNDVDFFLMDNRSFRSADFMNLFINNQANPDKVMYGKDQMNWLKNALISSTATFKIVVTGSQMINQHSAVDCLVHYPIEYNDLMNFLSSQRINGLLFLTGDKHISEINNLTRDTLYPLYDITVSPLTAGVSKLNKQELENPMRITGSLIEEHNYGRLSFLGNKNDRRLVIEFVDHKGITKFKHEITAEELKHKKK